jgi:hypothetical protein
LAINAHNNAPNKVLMFNARVLAML